MHILTKVLVFVAAILAVFLSALTISYASNAHKITQSLSDAQLEVLAARASLAEWGTREARWNSEKEEAVSRFAKAAADLQVELSQLRSENANLKAGKAQAEAARESIAGKIAELSELAKSQQTLLATFSGQLASARKSELDLRSQALGLESKLSDIQSQNEVLDSTVRALREQLAEAKRIQDSGGAATASTGGAAEPFVYTGELIQGRVEQITADPSTGKTLAKINVGTNSNIRENMKLFVIRDGSFVANLIIEKTDLQWAIGRIDTLGRPVTVGQGDLVWSRTN
ncbi:MAG: hypothetical protein IT434_04925 [Phycisphaerales bacterium]|nr:hypothetical protein [Phycisphaerales bacterium]